MDRSVLDTLGSPLVQVDGPEGATVAAKLESANPGGSAKDRPALWMIRAAEEAGDLEPGDRIVEPTSGNTGIGLSLVSAARGYDITIVMPASKSEERRQLMRAFGAEIELVDGDISDARERAEAGFWSPEAACTERRSRGLARRRGGRVDARRVGCLFHTQSTASMGLGPSERGRPALRFHLAAAVAFDGDVLTGWPRRGSSSNAALWSSNASPAIGFRAATSPASVLQHCVEWRANSSTRYVSTHGESVAGYNSQFGEFWSRVPGVIA